MAAYEKVCSPIINLNNLLDCSTWPLCRATQIINKRTESNGPKALICHDMMGGYLSDVFHDGTCCKEEPYVIWHWNKLDVFVYFSHHLVTIPPCGWINAAHRNGVRVLGTFIVEWGPGSTVMKDVLNDVSRVTQSLAQLAKNVGFDGWLLNVECPLQHDQVDSCKEFVGLLREETRKVLGDESMVLWYDSVTHEGKLEWQNVLNDRNVDFFRSSDGIFLNYCWTWDQVPSNATYCNSLSLTQHSSQSPLVDGASMDVERKPLSDEAKKHRVGDIFVGIDVFGRNTKHNGGFETGNEVKRILSHGLSVAVFAPGWVWETQSRDQLRANQNRFWGSFPVEDSRRFVQLPLETYFCRGVTKDTDNAIYRFNLNNHQLQAVEGDVTKFAAYEQFASLVVPDKYIVLFNCEIAIGKGDSLWVETMVKCSHGLTIDSMLRIELLFADTSVVACVRNVDEDWNKKLSSHCIEKASILREIRAVTVNCSSALLGFFSLRNSI